MSEKTLEQQIKEIFEIEDHAARFDELRKLVTEMEAKCTSLQELRTTAITFGAAVDGYMRRDPVFMAFTVRHKLSEIKAQKPLPTRTMH